MNHNVISASEGSTGSAEQPLMMDQPLVPVAPQRLWSRSAPQPQRFPVVEKFGPTIQGEGALIGVRTLFVRFGYCNDKCSWCDSKNAVDPLQVKANAEWMTWGEILEWVGTTCLGTGTEWVTLSGGNPAIHDLTELVIALGVLGVKVAVETQGNYWRDWLRACDLVTISPKPPSSGNPTDHRALTKFLAGFIPLEGPTLAGFVLKVVIFDDLDFEYAKAIHRNFPRVPFYLSVGNPDLSPNEDPNLARNHLELLCSRLRWLIEKTVSDPTMTKAIVLPQLHVLAFGNRKGV